MGRLMSILATLSVFLHVSSVAAEENSFSAIVASVKEAVVGVGTVDPIRRPQNELLGTGFAYGDGLHILTARHVVYSRNVGAESAAVQLSIFVGDGDNAVIRKTEVVYEDSLYDVAILKIEGSPIPVLAMDDKGGLEDGIEVGFTGFPIGAAYGLYKATHRGIISATTPLAQPQRRKGHLSPEMILRLRQKRLVYQLDATSYPGNSGGPLFNAETGTVIGMISSTYVHESKDASSKAPGGITFAMPSPYLIEVWNRYQAVGSNP